MENGRQCVVPRQAATTAATRLRPVTESDRRAASQKLHSALLAGRNADGGWGYYPGKTSRLEPTCWATLALGSDGPTGGWLAQCQRSSGWLTEDPGWPANIAFNALAAFVLASRRESALNLTRRRLLDTLVASKGRSTPQTDAQRQDNSLQGWSWIDATFSWVEPTCWGLLALKKARSGGVVETAINARIDEAERLLIDRSCRAGGWNYGNATVLNQELRPYVPTTALGLLAMQDRRDHDVVARGLAALEALWPEELSTGALGLSLICLNIFGRPADLLTSRLVDHVDDAVRFGSHHGIALALFALSSNTPSHAFRL